MNVTLPNGKVIKNVPEGTTKQQVMDKAIASGLATADDFGIAQPQQPLSPVSASEVPAALDGSSNQQQDAQGNTFADVANEAACPSAVGPLDSGTATLTARVAVPLRGASELRAHSRSTRSASIVPSASGVIRPAAMALRTAASDTPRWRA